MKQFGKMALAAALGVVVVLGAVMIYNSYQDKKAKAPIAGTGTGTGTGTETVTK